MRNRSRGHANAPTTVALAVVLALAMAVGFSGVDPVSALSPRTPRTNPAPAGQAVLYSPPVDAPVVDPFRMPDGPYGSGNRGWEYDTAPGTPIVAAGDGTVTFSGPVGGSVSVTVAHDDGLRTSYTNLADYAVRAGDQVQRGQVIGHSDARFHFGLRRGDDYLDPATILGDAANQARTEIRVRLVPRR